MEKKTGRQHKIKKKIKKRIKKILFKTETNTINEMLGMRQRKKSVKIKNNNKHNKYPKKRSNGVKRPRQRTKKTQQSQDNTLIPKILIFKFLWNLYPTSSCH